MKKNLRYFMTLLLMMVASVGWAEDKTVTITINSFTNLPQTQTYGTYLWTADGVSGKGTIFGGESAESMQMNSSNRLIYSTTPIQGKIKSINIVKASGSNRSFQVYGSTAAYTGEGDSYGTLIGSAQNIQDGTGRTWNVTNEGDFNYFVCRLNASNAAYLASITVTYEEVISTKTLSSIALSGDYPTNFQTGDVFSHSGMTVTATYDDNSTADVTGGATFSGYNMSNTGEQTVTVSYTEGGVTITAEYKINVTAFTIQDGVFDFTRGEDYGSEITPSSTQLKADKPYVFTAGNISITTSGSGNFLWNEDFRLYANSFATIAAPEGYVITKIVFKGKDMKNGTIDGVAFPNATEYTWEGSSQSVTIARASGTIIFYSITVTYEEGTPKDNVEMSFNPTSATATLGEDFTEPQLTTNPTGLEVTYKSSDENVAIVAADGTVTLVDAGTTTITASFAGDNTYNAGSASYTLRVETPAENPVTIDPYGNVTFSFANNAWGIPSDKKEVDEKSYSYGEYTFTFVGTTGNGYRYYPEYKYVLLGKEGASLTLPVFDFDLFYIEVVGRDGASTGVKQNIYVGETAVSTETTGATGTNTYKIASDYQAKGTVYTLKITSDHNTQFTSIKVCKKQAAAEDVTFTISDKCTDGTSFFGTFYTDKAYVMPDGVTGQTVAVDADGKLEVNNAYAAGSVVPAKTPLLMKATTAGEKTATVTTEEGSAATNNMLKGTLTADEETTGGDKYYRLTMHNGTTLGFYYGAADGAAFKPGANKAYLAVPASTTGAKEGFALGETTGINNVNVNENESGKIFNLAGQQMKSAVKGVYIKNGKKYIK